MIKIYKTFLKKIYYNLSDHRIIIIAVSLAITLSIFFFNFSEIIKNKKKIILAINHQRFRKSIEKLNNNEFGFIKLPLFWQFFLIGKFSKELDNVFYDYFYDLKTNLHLRVQKFLKKHFDIIFYFFKFDAIISANFLYKQDIDFTEIFKNLNKKYIILQEENVGIIPTQVKAFTEMVKKFTPSKADLILTYNTTTKNALINAGFVNAKKIHATGCLRYADLLKKFKKRSKNSEYKKIVFYSFQFNSYINTDPAEKYKHMPAFGNEGLVNFFKNTHNLLIDFASENPKINLDIKIKWPGIWEETIYKNWKKFSGQAMLPKNVRIISSDFNSSIFENADLIISWVSTTILESFILDKPILIPKFDEAKKKYDNFIDLSEYKKTCTICENKNLFINQVKKNLTISNVSSKIMSQRKKLINKYLTTNTTKMIKETKNRIIKTID